MMSFAPALLHSLQIVVARSFLQEVTEESDDVMMTGRSPTGPDMTGKTLIILDYPKPLSNSTCVGSRHADSRHAR